MGNLLKLINRSAEIEVRGNVFLDFENAQPTEEEMEVYTKINDTIVEFEKVLSSLKSYPGAEYVIKKVIDDPTDDNASQEVWNLIEPLVCNLKKSYELSETFESCIPPLLEVLCKGDNSIKNFERMQALARAFSKVLDFTMAFDAMKIKKPCIQNDFSYYRRMTSRGSLSDSRIKVVDNVQGEMVNNILLFLANPTPFMSKISEVVNQHFKKDGHPNIASVTDCFATLALLCKLMSETPSLYSRFKMKDTKLFCLRVMVGLLILYDHVHPNGAFCKGSNIDIKSFIKLLKEQDEETKISLLRSIRFSSKHFNDVTTPPSVKVMLDDS